MTNSAALVAPRAAWFGGERRLLEWRPYTPDRFGGPATAWLSHREDRSAQLGHGPENLGDRAAANYRSLNGSAASVVNRSSYCATGGGTPGAWAFCCRGAGCFRAAIRSCHCRPASRSARRGGGAGSGG